MTCRIPGSGVIYATCGCLQGILFSSPDCLPDHSALVRLWVHEATRVYHDKLVEDSDRDQFKKLIMDAVKKVEVSS